MERFPEVEYSTTRVVLIENPNYLTLTVLHPVALYKLQLKKKPITV